MLAVYLGFDGATNRVFKSDQGSWVWIEAGNTYLEAGSRRVSIGYGEPGLKLDVFAIVADASISAADLERLATSQSWHHNDRDGADNDEPATVPEPAEDEPGPAEPAPGEPRPTGPTPATRTMSMVGDPSPVVRCEPALDRGAPLVRPYLAGRQCLVLRQSWWSGEFLGAAAGA